MRTFCFICAFLLAGSLSAESNNPVRQNTTYLGTPTRSLLNINNWAGWIQFDGISAYNPILGGAGVWYPRGTATIIFQDGIIWGGYTTDGISPRLRVGGQTYLTGTQPGHIISPGVAQNPNDPDVRIYRIRPDYLTVSDEELKRDAAELNGIDTSAVTQAMINDVRNQYALDWSEWPGDEGAPFYDLNSNGSWDPGTDEPGLLNADQVLWFVCNDLNSSLTTALYGSPPIGIELQVTMWGYKNPTVYAQTAFRRYRIINKSGYTIDSMFVAQWSDPDVGDAGNDFAGCDSLQQTGYAYNGYLNDNAYQQFGLPPAAIGYCLLQGPIVPSQGDTALFDFRKIADYRNLPLTSFSYHSAGTSIQDPTLGYYSGTLQWYNMLNGYQPTEDTVNVMPFLHGSGPYMGQPTKFPLNGNPYIGTGDLDGAGNNFTAGERRITLSSGPFTMQPGDTQEIVLAIVGGIVVPGNNLLSVNQLLDNVNEIHSNYIWVTIEKHELPRSFRIFQNYPNPFNPSTTIQFVLDSALPVSVEIFDLTGRKVKTLLNRNMSPGQHKITWDGRDNFGKSVGSGMYFCHLKTGNMVRTVKMMLLK